MAFFDLNLNLNIQDSEIVISYGLYTPKKWKHGF